MAEDLIQKLKDRASSEPEKKIFSPKNIIFYLVVALVIYGVIYYFFLPKKRGDANPNASPASNTQAEIGQGENVPPALLAILYEQNGSRQNGSMILTQQDDKVRVIISLTNTPKDVVQPAHFHSGDCRKLGDIKYPLNSVVNGDSDTVLDVSFDDLKKELPLVVNVHKSETDIKSYVSCGAISVESQ